MKVGKLFIMYVFADYHDYHERFRIPKILLKKSNARHLVFYFFYSSDRPKIPKTFMSF